MSIDPNISPQTTETQPDAAVSPPAPSKEQMTRWLTTVAELTGKDKDKVLADIMGTDGQPNPLKLMQFMRENQSALVEKLKHPEALTPDQKKVVAEFYESLGVYNASDVDAKLKQFYDQAIKDGANPKEAEAKTELERNKYLDNAARGAEAEMGEQQMMGAFILLFTRMLGISDSVVMPFLQAAGMAPSHVPGDSASGSWGNGVSAAPGAAADWQAGNVPTYDGTSQFGFVGNGSFNGVDPRLQRVLRETAENFPLRVRVASGREGRGHGDHADGNAVDITLYDQAGNALANYQSAQTFRAYQAFAQAALIKARELYPDLTDGRGDDFTWGGLFGDDGAGGFKYGSMDTMHFAIADNSRFRAGTIMGGLEPGHAWYAKGALLGGSKAYTPEALAETLKDLATFRLTPEQAAENNRNMYGVAKASGRLTPREDMLAVTPNVTDTEKPKAEIMEPNPDQKAELGAEQYTKAVAAAQQAVTSGVVKTAAADKPEGKKDLGGLSVQADLPAAKVANDAAKAPKTVAMAV